MLVTRYIDLDLEVVPVDQAILLIQQAKQQAINEGASTESMYLSYDTGDLDEVVNLLVYQVPLE